jgi:hypothetical protein
MKTQMLISSAHTKEDRQKRLEKFFRVAFAHVSKLRGPREPNQMFYGSTCLKIWFGSQRTSGRQLLNYWIHRIICMAIF